MWTPIQWLLSIFFIIQMYVMMAVIGILFIPLALMKRDLAFTAVHLYCRWVCISARLIVGIKCEIRGEAPQDEVLIGAKHQSFLDIIMIASVVPRPKFIMKKELMWAPILGFYAKRLKCIAVDRGKRSAAIKKMIADAKASSDMAGQLIIFPQGTRVAPAVKQPYKIGAGVLYDKLKQDCVPAATNVGVLWPKHSLLRKRGVAVVEFLPRIEKGKELSVFMRELEEAVEGASDRFLENPTK